VKQVRAVSQTHVHFRESESESDLLLSPVSQRESEHESDLLLSPVFSLLFLQFDIFCYYIDRCELWGFIRGVFIVAQQGT
jgi:hypothetical protein